MTAGAPWLDVVEAVADVATAVRRIRSAVGDGDAPGPSPLVVLRSAVRVLERIDRRVARADPREGREAQQASQAVSLTRAEILAAGRAILEHMNATEER